MRSRALAFFALAFALIGLGASIASFVDYLRPAPTFCAESGCATVRASGWSNPLGIPLPALGTIYFIAMAVLAFWSRPKLRVVLAALGAAVGISLIALQAFSIGAWCKVCLVADPAAIVSAILVVAGAGTLRVTLSNIAATVPAVGLVVLGLGLYSHRIGGAVGSEPVPEFVAVEQQPGKVTIVEFVDFQCPYCRALDKKLTEALARTRRPVHIVRKMMPLQGHGFAVPAAMAWCSADAQGKGDAMAAELFAAEPEHMTPAGCEALAIKVGCDVTKYRETFASAELQARIKKDMADFQAAKLNGLPTIFIGKQKFEGSDHTADALFFAIERAGSS
ncbi:MAG TPA: DsbA family protein [Kofleriaceae bacterium]